MNNQENISLPINHRTFIIKDSDIDFEISSGLLGQKYHSNLSLKLYLSNESNISSLAKCLSNLNHLSSLEITIFTCKINQDFSMKEVLTALKSFLHLKNFSLTIDKQNEYFIYDEFLIEFSDFLQQQTKLETFSLDIYGLRGQSQEGRQSLIQAIKNLKCLEELNLKLKFFDMQSENDFRELYASINELPNLRLLSYSFFVEIGKQVFHNQLRLDNLNQLQVLCIHLYKYFQLSLTDLSRQLKQVFSLQKLTIDIKSWELQEDVNILFNTAFTLKNLEKFDLELDCNLYGKFVAIGEEVCEDSKIKDLKIQIKDQKFISSREYISFLPQIKNLKNIEQLYLCFDNLNFSQESVSSLSEWKNGWAFLKELYFESYNRLSQQESPYLDQFFDQCFSHSRSLIKLTLFIYQNYNQRQQSRDLFSNLSQLSNLQSLQCSNLFDSKSESLEQRYITCFQRISQLRELVIDNIDTEGELLYLGKSLIHLQKLEKLHVSLNGLTIFAHLNIFCQNLAQLKNLVSLQIETSNLFGDETEFMNLSHIKMLLKGISELINLKNLKLQLEVQNIDKSLYHEELQRFIRSLKDMVTLSMSSYSLKISKQKLMKSFKKLVRIH